MIAQLHDSNGRVAIPGFYDGVRQWSEEERERMAASGPSDSKILHDARAHAGWGECGYSLYERTTIRPALSVTGISGGYSGPGVKAVIPARAVAKVNVRLVPDQKPPEIEQAIRHHIACLTPPTVRSTVRTLAAARPALLNRRHPAMCAAITAYRQGFGATPVFVRSGGTIPVVNMLQTELGIPTVMMGFALPDDRIHAPNEKFHLPNFYRGITTCITFLDEIGRSQLC
jgi:acetylornithine deacetylase/succinyl-diaminopimelate desuccinylase-like protein